MGFIICDEWYYWVMATPGIPYELTEETKQYAVKYVEESGLFKNRLADFLSISRPTLDRVLEENEDFFTALKRADSVYCKSLIDIVSKKNPIFILRTKYRAEFDEKNVFTFDPEVEFQRTKKLMMELTHDSDEYEAYPPTA